MKHVNVSAAIRTALLWLRDHLRRAPRLSEPEQAAYDHEQERTAKPVVFIPVVYEPPERTTDPTQEIHQLIETGRITALIRTEKLPRVKLSKTHFYKLLPSPEEVQADRFLLDAQPVELESALDQLSRLVETEVKLEAVRQRHEGRGKAS